MKKIVGTAAALALSAGLAWAVVKSQEGPPGSMVAKEHELLKKFAGAWDSTVSFRETADGKWIESKGTENCRMLGDLWLVSEWKGEMGGMTMLGLGTMGFDPFKKKYVSTWISNMEPVLGTGEGSFDGMTLTTSISSTDCRTGKPAKVRMTQEFKDADTLIWSMFMSDKDGKEFECMKGKSKRKK